MSPWPRSCSAPISPRIVRESIFEVTWKEMRVGKFALMVPVITSTDGRCVARVTRMPAGRARRARGGHGGEREGAGGRGVRLDGAGDHVRRWALRGEDHVDAGGAGHLGETL